MVFIAPLCTVHATVCFSAGHNYVSCCHLTCWGCLGPCWWSPEESQSVAQSQLEGLWYPAPRSALLKLKASPQLHSAPHGSSQTNKYKGLNHKHEVRCNYSIRLELTSPIHVSIYVISVWVCILKGQNCKHDVSPVLLVAANWKAHSDRGWKPFGRQLAVVPLGSLASPLYPMQCQDEWLY